MQFIIISYFKGINGNKISLENANIYTLEEQKNIFNFNSIKDNPYLATEYLINIFNNFSRLNFTLFDKNVNKLKEEIYFIIQNKNKYKDLYIILSSIYGAFLADAMGSNTEFKPKDKNNHLLIYGSGGIFKPGQITDDSEMAMSQAFAILDNYQYKSLNPNLLYYYYIAWYKSKPLDIGTTTSKALSYLDFQNLVITDENIFTEKIKNKIKDKNYESLANGFLMRSSPFLTWFYMVYKDFVSLILETKSINKYFELYKKIHDEFSKDTQCTHPNPETSVAGSIMIFMGLCAMQQKYSGKEILEMTKILLKNNYFSNMSNENEYKLKLHFEDALNQFSRTNFSKDEYFGNLYNQMGFYKHAFNLTLYYLYVFDEQKDSMSMEEIYLNMMYDISDFGGDTDTNGAIVGMIMGPLIGMENFSKKYFDVFLKFYSRERLIYTNVLMYFYAKYLEEIKNCAKNIEKDKYGVNFYFIEMILKMLNTEININN